MAETSTRPPRRLKALAVGAGILTVLCAVALPLAPVEVNDPSVSWPVDPAAPRSTLLALEAGKPLGLTAGFSCAAVDSAAAADVDRASHVLLATTDPDQPAAADGLRLTAESGFLTAFLGTNVVFREPITARPCHYRIHTEAQNLVYTKDGWTLGTSALPDVDALITSITALPGRDLDVSVRVDDRFASTPAPAKLVLLAAVAAGLLVSAGCLIVLYRRPARRKRFRPRAADVVVGVTLLAWLFLAPRTSDDGWMYAMAVNREHAGYFGNYYMYHNNSYVPFTWLLQLYAWWSELGTAPVLQRVPSLVFAIVTWLGVRGAVAPVAPGKRLLVPALLFLAWWLPFGLGTRQEASVSACLTITVCAVLHARRRQRAGYLGLAVGAASLGLIAHTAGVLVLLPLALGAKSAARLVRTTARSTSDAVAVVLCVVSCAAIAAVAGFADGSLSDFLRGSSSFGGGLDTGPPDPLGDELDRYRLLLGEQSTGNFALRAPVLLLLLVVPFFVLLCVRARQRRRPLPWTLWLTGWTCALGLVLLVCTPSKWPWHFGAFAGVATIFLSRLALAAPALSRRYLGTRRLSFAVSFLLLAGSSGWIWLAAQGRNTWADDVLPGVPLAGQPLPGAVAPAVVLAGAVVVTFVRRDAFTALHLARAFAVLFLVGELAFLVGGFALAAVRTRDSWSPWADAVADPLARRCGEARVLRAADPASARPVAVLAGGTGTDGFDRDVWAPGSPPEPGPATAEVYGSLADGPATMTTPWLRLPADLSPDRQLMTTVSGVTGAGNTLTAEYAVPSEGGYRPVGRADFAAPEDSLSWRDVSISDGTGLPAGATAFRLTAKVTRDWLSFAMPTARDVVPVGDFLPRDGHTLVDWQLNWLYPCQGQPVIANGVVAPVSYAVAFGFGPDGSEHSATAGGSWAPEVGGILGSQNRASTVTRLYTRLDTEPVTPMRTVYRLDRPYADAAYRISWETRTVMGWRTLPA
jgi:hypothetical protein